MQASHHEEEHEYGQKDICMRQRSGAGENYGSFNYVDENDVVIPSSKGAEDMCSSFAERFIIALNK